MNLRLRTNVRRLAVAAAAVATLIALPVLAAGTYDTGASDTEIKIGNTDPYSGPASIYGLLGKTEAAYFKMLNDKGGINGRKINFISYDDAYSPPKTVEMVRKLVESDGVLALVGMLGTASNSAVMKYLNAKMIPHLFVVSGATKFSDPAHFPWTMGYLPSYASEAAIYGKAIMATNPGAKIAVFYQNDDYGKDYVVGLKTALGDKANQIVAMESYETTEPTIDSHILNLKASGADTFVLVALSKFASQAIRKTGELGWKPQIYLTSTAVAVDKVLEPAGLEYAKGIISTTYFKHPDDPSWADDPEMKEFFAFMDKYLPGESKNDQSASGYMIAQLTAHVLEKAGDNLTRANVMKIAASLRDVRVKLVLKGITLNTGPDDYVPIQRMQLMRFDGAKWQLIDDMF